MTALTLLMMALAYLAGSLSSAILICRLFGLTDPRLLGSGNPGATNVYRIGGRIPAALTLVVDILKGTIPVWGSYFLGIQPLYLGIIAICACLGHMFPLYFHFRGGKGVATALGAMLPIGLDLSGALIAAWIVTVLVTGYSSLGALITVGAAPFLTWYFKPLYTIPVAMLSVLIIIRHHENIGRLFTGQEGRVWDKGNTKE